MTVEITQYSSSRRVVIDDSWLEGKMDLLKAGLKISEIFVLRDSTQLTSSILEPSLMQYNSGVECFSHLNLIWRHAAHPS